MSTTPDLPSYTALTTELREIALLRSFGSVLGWDERTAMPAAGADFRAEQLGYLARIGHERFVSPKVGDLLAAAGNEVKAFGPHTPESANVRETLRVYERARKLPTPLVEELTRTGVLSQRAWEQARANNDFAAFLPWLEKMFALKRQEIACLGYTTEPYDAVLEDFEPGETAANLRKVFGALRGPLVDLVGRIVSSGKVAPLDILQRHYPRAAQEAFAKEAAIAIGFDFSAGLLAASTHPFCSGLGPGDTRMTTRYDERYFPDCFFSVLHETGHALYDQGLPREHFGLPAGNAISLGIHESQSRMWENLVGRSHAFWQHFFPKAQAAFPDALKDVSLRDWVFAVNDIRPSFIRVEADEATYNLHVLLRFELETALLSGDLTVRDLPAAWNDKVKTYLGLTVPTDTLGCLQDVHWSDGLIGYFPTYTLGNLCAAQFFDQARQDLGDLDALFSRGEFSPLLTWLRTNIHSVGQRYTAPELVKKVTGKPLSPDALLRHLKTKAADLYGV